MTEAPPNLALLALYWLGYFLLHSLLATHRCKDWVTTHWPRLAQRYRLFYNLLALILLLPLAWWLHPVEGPWLWQWQGAAGYLADTLTLLALLTLVWSLGAYSGSNFLGLQRQQAARDDGPFHLSTLHRWVRHPWYTLALVLIWTRDLNASLLLSNLLVSAYLVIGSRLEERKLVIQFGEAYRQYLKAVPGLIPLPWRHLTRDGSKRLLTLANGGRNDARRS